MANESSIFFVYCVTCLKNGKRYIGLTNNSVRRWRDHVKISRSDKAKKSMLHHSIRKHGAAYFIFDVVYEAVDLREAVAVERGLIAQYGTMAWDRGYNCTAGGETLPGGRLSQSVKDGLSAKNRGRCVDPEYRARRMEKNGGSWHTAETIAKISAKKRNCKLPTAYVDERRAKNGGNWHPKSQPEKLKALWATQEFREKQNAAVTYRRDKRKFGTATASVRRQMRTLPLVLISREAA